MQMASVAGSAVLAASNLAALIPLFHAVRAGDWNAAVVSILAGLASAAMHASETRHGWAALAWGPHGAALLNIDRAVAVAAVTWGLARYTQRVPASWRGDVAVAALGLTCSAAGELASPTLYVALHLAWHAAAYWALCRVIRTSGGGGAAVAHKDTDDAASVAASVAWTDTDCVGGKVDVRPHNVDVVVFHAGCADGSAAATVVWLACIEEAIRAYVGGRRSRDVTFIGCNYSSECKSGATLGEVSGKRVLVVDYSFPRDTMARLLSAAAAVLVLDHHASAEADLHDVPDENKVFVRHQCGATLAFNWAKPGCAVPRFLRLIEDYDLWRKAMADTEAFNMGLPKPLGRGVMGPQAMQRWVTAYRGGDAAVLALGAPRVALRDELALAAAKHAVAVTIRDTAITAAVVSASTYKNEVADALLSGRVLAATIAGERKAVDMVLVVEWRPREGTPGFHVVVSLRSREGVDCVPIARRMDPSSGGHARASGASTSAETLEALLVY